MLSVLCFVFVSVDRNSLCVQTNRFFFFILLKLISLWAIFCNMVIVAVPVPDTFRRSFSADIVIVILVIINISVIVIAAGKLHSWQRLPTPVLQGQQTNKTMQGDGRQPFITFCLTCLYIIGNTDRNFTAHHMHILILFVAFKNRKFQS